MENIQNSSKNQISKRNASLLNLNHLSSKYEIENAFNSNNNKHFNYNISKYAD
jgi:hypothetical protein